MPETVGVIPALSGDRSAAASARVLGVPLLLWAVNTLRRALPVDRIVALTADEALAGLAARHGVGAAQVEPAAGPLIRCDVARPFLSRASLVSALDAGADEAHARAEAPVERLCLGASADIALLEAVARGLPPDDPCVVGVNRLRLPLATPIEAVISDVDGVLTDGRITIDSAGAHARAFHMHDGLGARQLAQAGVLIGWLSAGADDGTIRSRAERLGVQHVDVGEGDKGPRFDRLCARMGADPARTIYLGDDENDLPAMARAALTACPADGQRAVRTRVDLVLESCGGRGAFRELAEILLDEARLAAQTRPTSPLGGATQP